MSSSEPPASPVGSPVVWTATAAEHGEAPVYQFRVGPAGGPSQVVRDFSPSNSFTWDPLEEGNYVVQVTVKDGVNDAAGETADASFTAASRASGPGAVISPTSNPLVALYSVPPSSSGGLISVQFKPAGSRQPWRSTAGFPSVPGEGTNVLVAGLLPRKTYLMRHVLADGTISPPSRFTTGALPSNVRFPTFTVEKAPSRRLARTQNVVFHGGVQPPIGTVNTLATDLTGKVVWYYDPVANNFTSYAPTLVPGGTVFLLGGKQNGVGGGTVLRQVNLAGDTLRETNVDALNAQLAALGQHAIIDINHDAILLPNGGTAVLATTPRTVDLHGTPTAYKGDMVIVLDRNFQVAWTWDPFAHLDTNRLPTLNEGPTDWTHANSIAWSPADGNLVVSMRSQDWVIKLDYANGTGDGRILWRLGPDGDFALQSSARDPWFSHQHDVRYIDNSTLLVFDNGNVRRSKDRRANSRGQALVLDEKTMQARLVLNVDLGEFAAAVGSAQRLPNGNFAFSPGISERTIEVGPKGMKTYVLKMKMPGYQYRSYIHDTLYSG